MHKATLVTYPQDWLEITWEITYYWSPIRPATYLDPPEGGLEIETEAVCREITVYPLSGEGWTISGIQEGSILDILANTNNPPKEEEIWEAAGDANEARLER